MALDEDTAALLDKLKALGMVDFADLTPAQARALTLTAPPGEPTAVASVEDRNLPGPGGPVPVRIYQPHGGTAPRPALLYFHGGGWVVGSLDSHDETARRLCAGADLCVVSVDYRLAPEHRYPAALDDCYAALAWVTEQAGTLQIDPGHLAVGGDSAGGNLAAAVALRARDENGPALAFQLLIYPVTQADFSTASYRDNAEGYFLTRRAMQWFWDHYVPDPQQRANAYAAPLAAADLSGLPPALVQTAQYDPLRDEGEAYAAALSAAGVPVQATRYDGLVHGFFGMQQDVRAARPALAEAVAALRRHLH